MSNKKTAIVTGYSSGLGAEITKGLINLGYTVIGVSRRKLKKGVYETEELKNIVEVYGDVSDPATVSTAFDMSAQHGNLDLVISCAGRGVFGVVGNYSASDIEEVLRGNLIGTILFSDAAVNALKANGGKIINVMSTAASVARKNETIYCASKWGARGYTESLRAELKGSNIQVIAVYPGGMNTSFWSDSINSNVDSSSFMSPSSVANRILVAISDDDDSTYISDIVINRP